MNALSKQLFPLAWALLGSPATLAQMPADAQLHLQERATLQQQVSLLEQALGRHDPALTEYLRTLAQNYAALSQHEESREILERAIQIQRSSEGLFTASQIPLFLSRMDDDVALGNWEEIKRDIEYLKWLLQEGSVALDDTTVEALVRLARLHLIGIAEDLPSERSGHYRSAAELGLLALDVSEVVWGISDRRRLDLHYGLLKLFYLQSLAVQRVDDTSYELRAIVPGSTIVRSREAVLGRLYYAGLNLFSAMADVISLGDGENKQEAQAMLRLYRADWDLMFNQDTAQESYLAAYSAMIAAAIPEATLDALFVAPQLLPVPRFHLTVQEAIAELPTVSTAAIEEVESFTAVEEGYLDTQDWYGDIPAVRFPIFAPSLLYFSASGLQDMWLSFNLDSLNKVSRWVSGTYRSRLSVVDDYRLLNADNMPEFDPDELDDRLHSVQFRPRLASGIPSSFRGTLLYRVSAN